MSDSQIMLYDGDDGIKIQVLLENESVWLSLNQIAELFDRDKSTISKHIKNIFDSGELSPNSVVQKMQELLQMVKSIRLKATILI